MSPKVKLILINVFEVVFFLISFAFQLSLLMCGIATVNIFSMMFLLLFFLIQLFPSFDFNFFSGCIARNYLFTLFNFFPRVYFVYLCFFLSLSRCIVHIIFESTEFYDSVNDIEERELNIYQLFGIVRGELFLDNFFPSLLVCLFSFLFVVFYMIEFFAFCRRNCLGNCIDFYIKMCCGCFLKNEENEEEPTTYVRPLKIYTSLYYINFFLVLILSCLNFTILNYLYFLIFLNFIILMLLRNNGFRKQPNEKKKSKKEDEDEKPTKKSETFLKKALRKVVSRKFSMKTVGYLVYLNYLFINAFTIIVIISISLSRFFWFEHTDFTYIFGYLNPFVLDMGDESKRIDPKLTSNERIVEEYSKNSIFKHNNIDIVKYFWNYNLFYINLIILFYVLSYSINLVYYNRVILRKNTKMLRKKLKKKRRSDSTDTDEMSTSSVMSPTDIDTSDVDAGDLNNMLFKDKDRKTHRSRVFFFGKNHVLNFPEIFIKLATKIWVVQQLCNYLTMVLIFVVLSFVVLTFPNAIHIYFLLLIFFGFLCFRYVNFRYCVAFAFCYVVFISNVFFVFNVLYTNSNSVPQGPLRNYYDTVNYSQPDDILGESEREDYAINRNLTFSKLQIRPLELTVFQEVGILSTNFQSGNSVILCYCLLIFLFGWYLKSMFCFEDIRLKKKIEEKPTPMFQGMDDRMLIEKEEDSIEDKFVGDTMSSGSDLSGEEDFPEFQKIPEINEQLEIELEELEEGGEVEKEEQAEEDEGFVIVREEEIKIEENSRYLSNSEDVSHLSEALDDDILMPLADVVVEKIKRNRIISSVRYFCLNFFYFFVLRYSFMFSLIIIYICIFTSTADVFHGIYFVFFIVFFIHYNTAKRFWIFLIMYTKLVILCYYVFNIFFKPMFFDPNYEENLNYYQYGRNGTELENFLDNNSIGESPYNSFTLKILHSVGLKFMNLNFYFGNWRILGMDSIILLVCYIQWYIFKYNLDDNEELLQKMIDDEEESQEKELKGLVSYHSFKENVIFVYNFFLKSTHFFRYFCYIIVICMLIFEKNSNLMSLGYFLLLFICLALDFLFPLCLQFFWYVFVIYTFVSLSVLYSYQLLFVRLLVEDTYDETYGLSEGSKSDLDQRYILYFELKDFGLVEFTNKTLSFIPYALLLIFSIMEIKLLSTTSINLKGLVDFKREKESIKKISTKLSKKMKTSIGYNNQETESSSEEQKENDEEEDDVIKQQQQQQQQEEEEEEEEGIKTETTTSPLVVIFRIVFLRTALFLKKFFVIYNVKLILILLFLNAILDINPIGFGFLIILMLFSPFPQIGRLIWFYLVVYCEIIIILRYIFQFPFFESELRCNPPVPVPDDKLPYQCTWLRFLGLKRKDKEEFMGSIFILPLLLVVCCYFQRVCNRWKKEIFESQVDPITKKTIKREMLLLDEDYWIFQSSEPVEVAENDKKKNIHEKRKTWKAEVIRDFRRYGIEVFVILTNHFFDYFGYEICVFLMLFFSLVLLKTFWGLLLFVFFAFFLLIGKKITVQCKCFSVVIVLIGTMIIILYFFSFDGGAVPVYDYFDSDPYCTFRDDDQPPNYTILFNYFVIKADGDGYYHRLRTMKSKTVIVCLYLILYLMTQYNFKLFESSSGIKNIFSKYKSPQKLLHDERKRIKKIKKLKTEQEEEKQKKEEEEEEEDLSYEDEEKNRNQRKKKKRKKKKNKKKKKKKEELEVYIKKKKSEYLEKNNNFILNPVSWLDIVKYQVVYVWFYYFALSVFFLDAALGQTNNLNVTDETDPNYNPDDFLFQNRTTINLHQNFLKLVQLIIVLLFLNFRDVLRWKTISIWKWFGVYYLLCMLLNALYQPFLIILTPYSYREYENFTFADSAWFTLFSLFGVNYYQNSLKTNLIVYQQFFVLLCYYIQESIFIHQSYTFYTNYLYVVKKRVPEKYRQNKIFRSIQLLKNFNSSCLMRVIRKENLILLQKTKQINEEQEDDKMYDIMMSPDVSAMVGGGNNDSIFDEQQQQLESEEEKERNEENYVKKKELEEMFNQFLNSKLMELEERYLKKNKKKLRYMDKKMNDTYFFYQKFKTLFTQKHDFQSINYLNTQSLVISKEIIRSTAECVIEAFKKENLQQDMRSNFNLSSLYFINNEEQEEGDYLNGCDIITSRILRNEILCYNKKLMKKFLRQCYEEFKEKRMRILVQKERIVDLLTKEKKSCLIYFLLKYDYINNEDNTLLEAVKKFNRNYEEDDEDRDDQDWNRLVHFLRLFGKNEHHDLSQMKEKYMTKKQKKSFEKYEEALEKKEKEENVSLILSNDEMPDFALLEPNDNEEESQPKKMTKKVKEKMGMLLETVKEYFVFYGLKVLNLMFKLNIKAFSIIENNFLYPFITISTSLKGNEIDLGIYEKEDEDDKLLLENTKSTTKTTTANEKLKEETIIDFERSERKSSSSDDDDDEQEEQIKEEEEEEEGGEEDSTVVIEEEEEEEDNFEDLFPPSVNPPLSSVSSSVDELEHMELKKYSKLITTILKTDNDYKSVMNVNSNLNPTTSIQNIEEESFLTAKETECEEQFLQTLLPRNSFLYYMNIKYTYHLKRFWRIMESTYYSQTQVICLFAFALALVISPSMWNCLFTVFSLLYVVMDSNPKKWYWKIVLVYSEVLIVVQFVIAMIQILSNTTYLGGYKSIDLLGWKNSEELWLNIGVYLIIIISVLHHREILYSRGEWKEEEEEKHEEEEDDDDDDDEGINRKKKKKKYELSERFSFLERSDLESPESIRDFDKYIFSEEEKRNELDERIKKKFLHNEKEEEEEEEEEESDESDEKKQEGNIEFKLLEELEDQKKQKAIQKKKKTKTAVSKPSFFGRLKNSIYSIPKFYLNLGNNEKKPLKRDLLVITNLVDLVSIIWFILFFKEISGNYTNNVTKGLANNELSGWLVGWIMFFFLVLVFERVLYIHVPNRAAMTLKILLHFALVLTYHITYLIQYDKLMINQSETSHLSIWFILKLIVLWLSALQIKYGYPVHIFKEFFSEKFDLIDYYLWWVYRAIPFLFELLTLLSWTFKATSLTFFEWLKLEDIRTELYRRKCHLQSITKEEREITREGKGGRRFLRVYRSFIKPIGEKIGFFLKCGMGFLLFSVLFLILFFPLIWFSSANKIAFVDNEITNIRVRVGVEGYPDFYDAQMLIENEGDRKKTMIDYNQWVDRRLQGRKAFRNYDNNLQMQILEFDVYSENYWDITIPYKATLVEYLTLSSDEEESTKNITIITRVDITRLGPENHRDVSYVQKHQITGKEPRNRLIKLIQAGSTSREDGLSLPLFFDPFLINYPSGLIENEDMVKYGEKSWRPTCVLWGSNITDNFNQQQFWSIECEREFFDTQDLSSTGHDESDKNIIGLRFDVQSTKVALSTNPIMSFLNGFGILAFYTTIVMAIGTFLRRLTAGMTNRIFIEDMCDVDVLYKYVNQINLAREEKDLVFEEILYRKLISIFLNPTLVQIWSNDSGTVINKIEDNMDDDSDKDSDGDQLLTRTEDDLDMEEFDVREQIYTSSSSDSSEEKDDEEKIEVEEEDDEDEEDEDVVN